VGRARYAIRELRHAIAGCFAEVSAFKMKHPRKIGTFEMCACEIRTTNVRVFEMRSN
jgi:hypothetical protein